MPTHWTEWKPVVPIAVQVLPPSVGDVGAVGTDGDRGLREGHPGGTGAVAADVAAAGPGGAAVRGAGGHPLAVVLLEEVAADRDAGRAGAHGEREHAAAVGVRRDGRPGDGPGLAVVGGVEDPRRGAARGDPGVLDAGGDHAGAAGGEAELAFLGLGHARRVDLLPGLAAVVGGDHPELAVDRVAHRQPVRAVREHGQAVVERGGLGVLERQVPGLTAVGRLVDPALPARADREHLRDVAAVGLDVAEGQRLLGVRPDVLPRLAAVGGAPDAALVAADPGDLRVDGVEAAQALVGVREVDAFPRQPGTLVGVSRPWWRCRRGRGRGSVRRPPAGGLSSRERCEVRCA